MSVINMDTHVHIMSGVICDQKRIQRTVGLDLRLVLDSFLY